MNIVYITENKVNSKRYAGVHKTADVNDGYLGSGVALRDAVAKYGKENFHVTQRAFFDTYEEALEFEELLVDQSIVDDRMWYNLCEGGRGGTCSEETKQKLSNIAKNMPDEQKQRISNTLKGNNNGSGKRSNQFCLKMKEAATGRLHTEETKKKISASRKGHDVSEETRSKIGLASKGRKHTEETKKKISMFATGRKFKHKLIICDRCGAEGGKGGMNRYHFKNCKRVTNVEI